VKRPANLAGGELPDAVQEAVRDITNGFPGEVLGLGDDELLAWASVKVREPYRQQGGQCPLYGEIMGYRLVQAPGVSVRPDIEGWHVETGQEDFAPAEGSIQFRNKMFEVRRDGTRKIGAARKEPK
jgi:hypothetical protein